MRVALITGGTRGIGAAITIKLKESGYKVAAVYAGNDEVATKFSKENKVDIFKWSIANYEECVNFANKIADLAEKEDHHPEILIEWGKVTVTWWSHKIKGLHKNDFIAAAKTDQIFSGS